MVEEIVRPFLANFFLNNKLPDAFNASVSLEELVSEELAILPSGKIVVAEEIHKALLCCVVIAGVNLKENLSETF